MPHIITSVDFYSVIYSGKLNSNNLKKNLPSLLLNINKTHWKNFNFLYLIGNIVTDDTPDNHLIFIDLFRNKLEAILNKRLLAELSWLTIYHMINTIISVTIIRIIHDYANRSFYTISAILLSKYNAIN